MSAPLHTRGLIRAGKDAGDLVALTDDPSGTTAGFYLFIYHRDEELDEWCESLDDVESRLAGCDVDWSVRGSE